MAKASESEWKRCMDFANALDAKLKELDDEKLGAWVRDNYVWLGRTLFGYRVLVDNCCDPNSDTLEWKPEVAAAIAAFKQPEKDPCPE